MSKTNSESIILRMHPLQRIALSAIVTAIIFLILPKHTLNLVSGMLLWDVFSICYLVLSWIVLIKRTVPQIRRLAKKDDGSAIFVFLLILISSFAGLIMVLIMMISNKQNPSEEPFYLPVAIAGILLSWLMVHTIYTFHYAHMYYDDDDDNPEKDAHGLEFPDKNPKPDYVDFAYFAFVIGCTFQVSDIVISSSKIRRVVL